MTNTATPRQPVKSTPDQCTAILRPDIMMKEIRDLTPRELEIRMSVPVYSRYMYCDCVDPNTLRDGKPVSVCDNNWNPPKGPAIRR
jgi:hypothetical protein